MGSGEVPHETKRNSKTQMQHLNFCVSSSSSCSSSASSSFSCSVSASSSSWKSALGPWKAWPPFVALQAVSRPRPGAKACFYYVVNILVTSNKTNSIRKCEYTKRAHNKPQTTIINKKFPTRVQKKTKENNKNKLDPDLPLAAMPLRPRSLFAVEPDL